MKTVTTFSPVVIIGAPRSGTNMLRDALSCLPGFVTWPCDEINYIWRHRNVRYPSDELPADRATPRVRRYVRGHFEKLAFRHAADAVVEKTCANSLRVAFVDRIVPEARYIFIRRDGLDAVGSAIERWKGQLDWLYVLRKAQFIPLTDFPYYSARYLWNRLYRLLSAEQRLAFWGPKLDGMEILLARHSLEEVCALQWQRCMEKAAAAFEVMPADKYMEVAYEDFARSPAQELARILHFLGRPASEADLTHAVGGVSARSIGRGRHLLGPDMVRELGKLVGNTLQRYGYAIA